MDRELRGDTIRSRAAFREMVRSMTIEEIALLSDNLRERMEDLAEELQVLSEQVIQNRERVAAIRDGQSQA